RRKHTDGAAAKPHAGSAAAVTDPVSVFIGIATGFVAKPLIEAVSSHAAQEPVKPLLQKLKIRRETKLLSSTGELKQNLQSGLMRVRAITIMASMSMSRHDVRRQLTLALRARLSS